jgi:hypothetical protein
MLTTVAEPMISETAFYLARELEHVHREVVLAPAPDPRFPGHCIRVVQQANPEWYQTLAANWPAKKRRCQRQRHHDTDIRRPLVLAALRRIAAGRITGRYGHALAEICRAETA